MSSQKNSYTGICLLTTTTALLSSASGSASAVQKHTLRNETLSAVARKYHVSIKDLQAANNLTNINNIPDGRVLIIPPQPKHLHVEPSMHKVARTKKDRISLRLGPGEDYRRVNFVDAGSVLTMTAVRGGWAQVKLDSGASGWVRQDLVESAKHATPSTAVAHTVKSAAPVVKAEAHATHIHPNVKTAHAAHNLQSSPSKPSNHKHQVQTASKHSHGSPKHGVLKQVAHQTTHHERALKIAKAEHARRLAAKAAHAHHLAELAEGRSRRRHKQELAHAQSRHKKQVASARAQHSVHHKTAVVVHHTPAHQHSSRVASASGNGDIVRTAFAYRGTPYVYGGEGRGGFDCSGFTSYLYRHKGVSLPHSARAQFGMGRKVKSGDMKPGDLVFFHTVTPGISHVGMYVGNGKFVHASSRRSGGVRVDRIDSGYYSQAFRGARRFK